MITLVMQDIIIPTASAKVESRYTGFTLFVCLSICPSVRLSVHLWMEFAHSVSSTIYLSDSFHIYTFCQTTSHAIFSEIWIFGKCFKFDFIFFWLGIQYEWIEWLNMGQNYTNPGYGLSLGDTLWNVGSYRQPLEQEGNPMT